MGWFKSEPLTVLEVIENELKRLHGELNSYSYGALENFSDNYQLIVKQVEILNNHLLELSKNEEKSKNIDKKEI